MPIYALGEWEPEIADDAFVHPDAVIIGQVRIGAQSSVWPAAVIRGDWRLISIGARTSIQDGAVIHVDRQQDTVIGSDCTVGHGAHAEGCTISDGVLVGSRSAVLNGAFIGADSVVAAGCVVTPRTVVPERTIVMGVPGKIGAPGALEPGRSRGAVAAYIDNGRRYRMLLRRID